MYYKTLQCYKEILEFFCTELTKYLIKFSPKVIHYILLHRLDIIKRRISFTIDIKSKYYKIKFCN